MGDTDSEEEGELRVDEYSDRFEDYGFLGRAEEHKKAGNAEFQKERFEKALKEYDSALDQLLTVAYDKSIIIGKQKWNDVVVMRSTLHLNKSTCHFKLRDWRAALAEAQACLTGSLREAMMCTDPQIRSKIKEAERKSGGETALGALVEDRLPRQLRAKAWFRVSRCQAHLEYLDRAREALERAHAMCDDKQLASELDQHAARLAVLEKQQKAKQRGKFKGFFEKLQDRGGYVDSASEKKARWQSMDHDERLRFLEELDDSDGEDARIAIYSQPASGQVDVGASSSAGVERGRPTQPSLSFEDYLEREVRGEGVNADVGSGDAVASARPPAAESALASAACDPGMPSYVALEVRPLREQDTERRQIAWQERQRAAALDDLEDEELRKARERLRKKEARAQTESA